VRGLAALVGAFLACLVVSSTASADETVSVGGTSVVLLKPDAPVGSVILMPGDDGRIGAAPGGVITLLKGNQLVRTRAAYAARGLAVLVIDAGTDLSAAIQYMAAIKGPVTVIGTSRGTLRAAQGIAKGAKPDALVLTSGFLSRQSGSSENVEAILRSPSRLPPTLVIHHREDGCRVTRPAGVDPFIKWAAGRARITWLTGGISEGNPCKPRAHHGFNGLDAEVVALAAAFH
jgi:hypothetical protein